MENGNAIIGITIMVNKWLKYAHIMSFFNHYLQVIRRSVQIAVQILKSGRGDNILVVLDGN